MIPVLIVPVIRPGQVAAMLASVDVPVAHTIVIDQGAGFALEGAHVVHLPANIGVAAAWNLGLKATIAAPWWCIVNDDVVFAPGDLARLVAVMAEPGPKVATLDGFAAFGLDAATLDRVGFFDENFHPAYCEDADYEWRCALAGVPIVSVPAGLRHDRSSTIRHPHYAAQNARTYPLNRAYYARKWGGELRGGERYRTPFDAGGSVADWTLSAARLRSLAWEPPESR